MSSVGQAKNLDMIASLREARKEGFVPFTHAALYVYAGIDFDIIERFVDEMKIEVLKTYYEFDGIELINLPAPFGRRLYVINDNAYPAFCSWLESVEIVHPKYKGFCVPRRMAAPIMDPFMRMIGAQTPAPEVIDVWGVSTMAAQLRVETHVEVLPYPIFKPGEAEELEREEFLKRLPHPLTAPEKITLKTVPADPTIILRGKARLIEMGEKNESSYQATNRA